MSSITIRCSLIHIGNSELSLSTLAHDLVYLYLSFKRRKKTFDIIHIQSFHISVWVLWVGSYIIGFERIERRIQGPMVMALRYGNRMGQMDVFSIGMKATLDVGNVFIRTWILWEGKGWIERCI